MTVWDGLIYNISVAHKKHKWKPLNPWEKSCLCLGGTSVLPSVSWWAWGSKGFFEASKEFATYRQGFFLAGAI